MKEYIEKLKLQEVGDDELAKYFGDSASKDFGIWFDRDLTPWEDDIRMARENGGLAYEDDNSVLYRCHVEVSRKGHIELYEFYIMERYDNEDNLIDEKFYI